jgi:membrane protein required for colicin V production
MPITWLDIIVIIFMLVSGLLAMARGFTREVLSIFSWAAAAGAALVLFPRFQPMVREALEPKWLADIALVVGIFVVVLIIVSFITIRIGDKVLDSRIGALDRSFGFIFGLARGLVLVAIGYLFFFWLVQENDHPDWVREAKTQPLLDQTGDMILSILPDDPEAVLSRINSRALGGDGGESEEQPDGENGTAEQDAPSDSGYTESQRQGLNQLEQGTGGTNN